MRSGRLLLVAKALRPMSTTEPRRALLVVFRRLLEAAITDVVVLNPQLRAGFREKRFNRRSRHDRLRLIEVEGRHSLQRARLWKMIEITGQDDASGTRQSEVQHLMPWRVSGRELHDHRTVAEHVMFVSLNDYALAALQGRIAGRLRDTWRFLSEHRVALDLTHQPRRPGECVRVGRVVIVIVGEGQILDVRCCVARFSQLRRQRLPQRQVSCASIWKDEMVWVTI